MMPEIVQEAKTIEEAVANALTELNTDASNVEIEVLQEPGKGLFGKAKAAKVKVKLKEKGESNPPAQVSETDMQAGRKVLKEILDLIGIPDAEINTKQQEEGIVLMDINSEAGGLIIGKHGQTLSSLQYLINRIIRTQEDEKVKYILDVGEYRVRHQKVLEKMADSSAKKVIANQEKEVLSEMNAFDRRIIHMRIKENPEVETYSEGEGNYKKVVISPKSQENEEVKREP